MQPADLLATVPVSTDALLSAARAAGTDATVPTCEGWRTHDLVSHLAGVYRYVTAVVETGGTVSRSTLPQSPAGDAVFDDLAAACESLVAALKAIGPEGYAWNWATEAPTGAFWYRRMGHETAVHAVDAEIAAGVTPSVEPTLAADGIDELLTVLVPRVVSAGRAPGLETVGTLHVHCTDVDGEWLAEPAADSLTVRREHAKGDAALRGGASDLLLRLYNRGNGGEVVGDEGVLDRWRAIVRF